MIEEGITQRRKDAKGAKGRGGVGGGVGFGVCVLFSKLFCDIFGF